LDKGAAPCRAVCSVKRACASMRARCTASVSSFSARAPRPGRPRSDR
jgi:hypothetical protein